MHVLCRSPADTHFRRRASQLQISGVNDKQLRALEDMIATSTLPQQSLCEQML